LGRDLPRTVDFFRQVDRAKPTRAEVMKRHGIKNEHSVELVRAYENAIIETIAHLLKSFDAFPRTIGS
jgi:hypothetical protein